MYRGSWDTNFGRGTASSILNIDSSVRRPELWAYRSDITNSEGIQLKINFYQSLKNILLFFWYAKGNFRYYNFTMFKYFGFQPSKTNVLQQAYIFFNNNQFELSLKELDEIIVKDSTNADAFDLRGEVKYNWKRLKEL